MGTYTAFPIENRIFSQITSAAFSANAITLDMASVPYHGFTSTLDQNVNAGGITISNVPTGVLTALIWEITVDGTGGYNFPVTAFPSGTRFANSWSPDTAANAVIVVFLYTWDGGTTWEASHNSPAVMDSDFSANGIAVRTGAGAYANRTLTAGSTKIGITNGDGVAGNPTIDVNQANLSITESQISDLNRLANIVEDLSPQLGANLDRNGFDITSGSDLILAFTGNASAVNYLRVFNNSAGNPPRLGISGSDTNIDLDLAAKGTGVIKLINDLGANAKGVLSIGRATFDEPSTFTNVGASTYNIDMTSSQEIIRLNIDQAVTISAINIARGQFKCVLIQNATPFAVSWGTSINWGTAGAPSSVNGRIIVLKGFQGGRVHASQFGNGGFNYSP